MNYDVREDSEHESVQSPLAVTNVSSVSKNGWRELFTFTTRSHLMVLLPAISCACLVGIVQPALAIFLGRFFDLFSKYASGTISSDELTKESLISIYSLLGIGAATWILQASFCCLWIINGELHAKSIRDLLFRQLLRKDSSWYDLRSRGIEPLLMRSQRQIRDLQMGTSQPLGLVVVYVVQATASTIVAFTYNWRLTCVILSAAPVVALIVSLIQVSMTGAIEYQGTALYKATKTALNAIKNITTTKCHNNEEFESLQFQEFVATAAKHYLVQARVDALNMGFSRFATTAVMVVGVYYGTVLIHQGTSSVQEVLTAFWSCIAAATALEGITPYLLALGKARVASRSLGTILDHIGVGESIPLSQGTLCLDTLEGDIEFKDVSFSYPSRLHHPILRNATFFFPSGEITFLVGSSGSGKSTLANLLLKFYEPNSGRISIDGSDIRDLDTNWLRNNVTLVQQHTMLFNETLLLNTALGCHSFEQANTSHVHRCLDFAMLSETISSLQNGVNTNVGIGGSRLSGGQKQRVALARARLRDTSILILDESTSALDQTTRSAVMHNIRDWRIGKTTIIITHDLNQICDQDFVYVLKDGQVVAEGYQFALLPASKGLSLSRQGAQSMAGQERGSPREVVGATSLTLTEATGLSPSMGSNYDAARLEAFDHILDQNETTVPARIEQSLLESRLSEFGTFLRKRFSSDTNRNRNSSWSRARALIKEDNSQIQGGDPAVVVDYPTCQTIRSARPMSLHQGFVKHSINGKRVLDGQEQPLTSLQQEESLRRVKTPHTSLTPLGTPHESKIQACTLPEILRTILPLLGLREKIWLSFGFVAATTCAGCPPLVSYLITQMFTVFYLQSNWQNEMRTYSLAMLGVAIADGVSCYFVHYLLEAVGQHWIDRLRVQGFRHVLKQPRTWFDQDENSPSFVCSALDRNAEEIRNLLGRFAALIYIVIVMTTMALVWAMVKCWKLTLIGVASVPVMYIITQGFDRVSHRCETLSNEAGDAIAHVFSETFSDIRTVRALTLESHFHKKYTRTTSRAFSLGVVRGLSCGFFFGLSGSAVTFVTAAILGYGAILASSGSYSAEAILTVFSLLIFSTSNANSIVAFVPSISSSVATASRLLYLTRLPTKSHESYGTFGLEEDHLQKLAGPISFVNLDFSYPSRQDAPVLRRINLTIAPNQYTAIVGPSGSGKSTIASLLLGIYPPSQPTEPINNSFNALSPNSPTILISNHDIRTIHHAALRNHIALVPQTPVLLAGTVRENILYGNTDPSSHTSTIAMVNAAKDAGIHEFILTLPQSYDTIIGDGGIGMSGGQAQRITIARALARDPSVLILDEATSALDQDSAEFLRRSLRRLINTRCPDNHTSCRDTGTTQTHGRGLTVIVITHSREMMEIADHVVMLKDGRVAEQGSYRDLLAEKGALWQMLTPGGLPGI